MGVTDSAEGWTDYDERKFAEMSERRGRVLAKRNAEVKRAFVLAGMKLGDPEVLAVCKAADAIRDALEPFDSGVRCAD